ncbi:MAG TPA: bifunctional nicotinamidase/pyrazinamidase [Abditibacteriaceae bacterium]|jgi:nicotinamidase/pyrazinamidase
MKTLVIVDVQNDFCPGGALAVREGDTIVPIINALQSRFDLVVATQDWHPADHRSFASQWNLSPGELVELNGVTQVLWPDHCVQNTSGAELHPALETSRIAKVFHKGTDREVDSYSGFFDNGRRHHTGLERWLRTQGASELWVCGLATDYCVQATALDAVNLGFHTTVIADACRAVELQAGDADRAFAKLQDNGVRVVSSDEL